MQQVEHYCSQSAIYRSKVPRVDMILSGILASLGVRDAKDTNQVEEQVSKVVQGTISKEAREAWEAAGMPSPAMPWMMSWMMRHKDGCGRAESQVES
jgi:hypothetical protein